MRSWIDSDSVLTIPKIDTMMASEQQAVEQAQHGHDLVLLLLLEARPG